MYPDILIDTTNHWVQIPAFAGAGDGQQHPKVVSII
jgi:hypothetical protein